MSVGKIRITASQLQSRAHTAAKDSSNIVFVPPPEKRSIAGMMLFHYLKNGYELVESPYGQGVTIHDIDGLHDALGNAIVSSPEQLTGQEFRFLRVELNLSQAGLAAALGCNEQSVARWEKSRSRQVNAPAERILRMLYREAKHDDKKLAPLLKSLQDLECTPAPPRKFVASERRDTWSARAETF